jgi:hypothetical protein
MVIRAICLRQMIAEVLKVGGSTRIFSAILKTGPTLGIGSRAVSKASRFALRILQRIHLRMRKTSSVTLVSKAFIEAR